VLHAMQRQTIPLIRRRLRSSNVQVVAVPAPAPRLDLAAIAKLLALDVRTADSRPHYYMRRPGPKIFRVNNPKTPAFCLKCE
jgi:hypothetical protein